MSEDSKPHSELSDMLTKNISEVVVFFHSDEDGMKRYQEFTAEQFRGLFEQLEALQRALDEEQARRYHYQAHGKPGVQSFSDCEANECVDARASLASYPATEPLSDYCNWGTVCRLPVGHAGPHEYPASEPEAT